MVTTHRNQQLISNLLTKLLEDYGFYVMDNAKT